MADDTKDLWNHIGDLHKKHSELAVQMHEMKGGMEGSADMEGLKKCIDENTAATKEQTDLIKELIAAIKEDVAADRAEAGKGKK